MLVRQVVGELQLVEGDHLLHPLLPCRRAVRVDVHPGNETKIKED